MKNTNLTHQKSEEITQAFKNKSTLLMSVEIALERTNTPLFKLDNLVSDVLEEFKGKDIELITKAIRNGSLGLYGRTYKMSTQEVCIWIREYLKTHKVSLNNFVSNPYRE